MKLRNHLLYPLAIILTTFSLSLTLSSNLGDHPTARAQPLEALTLYVDAQNGSDTDNLCDTSTSPCKTIQRAVNVLYGGEFNPPYGQTASALIKIAAGTYTFDATQWSGGDLSPFTPCPGALGSDEAVVCVVDEDVTLEGGYTSGNWSVPSLGAEATIIDGGSARRGVIVIAFNRATHVNVRNLSIQNGRADEGENLGTLPDSRGGGMWLQKATADLKDVIFENNTAVGKDTSSGAGGAGSGGGLALTGPVVGRSSDFSTLTNVQFINNTAQGGSGPDRGGVALGGGLFAFSVNLTADGLTFTNNIAVAGDSSGSGWADSLTADALGGGMSISLGSTATLTNLTATGNQALGGNAGASASTQGGGGFGGALHFEESEVTLTDAYIGMNSVLGGDGGSGGWGFSGGIEVFNASATLNRVQVIANNATSGSSTAGGNAGSPGGGGLYINDQQGGHSVTLTNSVIADNTIDFGTGSASLGGGGGGLVVQGLTVTLNHVTLAQNRMGVGLKHGSAILIQATQGDTGTPGIANINYSILADNNQFSNQDSVHITEGSTANFNTDLAKEPYFLTNADPLWTGLPPGNVNGLETVIELEEGEDVGFVSPGAPDYDYHLYNNSPAIDQAISSTTSDDIDGETRPQGTAPDIGADEYNQPSLTVNPEALTLLAAGDATITRTVTVDVTSGPQIGWSASTTANWLYLGSSGTNPTADGSTGESLVLRLDPSLLSLGRHTTTVEIISAEAAPTSVSVTLIKAAQVFSVYLPLLTR